MNFYVSFNGNSKINNIKLNYKQTLNIINNISFNLPLKDTNINIIDFVPELLYSISENIINNYSPISIENIHDNSCSICLENNNLENSISLPCKHNFHKDCITKWFKKSIYCPYCKFNCSY